jgi:hypothetical protein
MCIHHKTCINCKRSSCGQKQHLVNYVVAQTTCEACLEEPLKPGSVCDSCGSRCIRCGQYDKDGRKNKPCADTCGHREVEFNTSHEFCSWLFSEQHKNFSVYAHNFRSFDGYFVLEYLIRNGILPNRLIYNGSKIMYLQVKKGLNIKLLDSLSYFNTKLSKLPDMFHLEGIKKNYFPHMFNTGEHPIIYIPKRL